MGVSKYVYVCGYSCQGDRGRGKKEAPFNYINSTAVTKALEQINGRDNGNRLSQGQRLQGR